MNRRNLTVSLLGCASMFCAVVAWWLSHGPVPSTARPLAAHHQMSTTTPRSVLT
ncbi:hypothetical protein [Sphingobium nicotianae]|uniref:Uncharacterized protein n=1 Tax=Sphingobium nicotianae TaxID=2782607 RepID=A0A9X1IT23_9SPHN|nr:hypothetical protein [Sphingobium nicotianae]MBT2189133.1 hypothetical protein [Sphingobium nicotianae]